MLLLTFLLACTSEAPAPAEGPPAKAPPSARGAEPVEDLEAAVYAARGAPSDVAPWSGAWRVSVYAAEPTPPGAASLAAGLGVRPKAWQGGRPPAAPGELVVVWAPAQEPVQALAGRLAPPPGKASPSGPLVVVLDPGADPSKSERWRLQATAELPWMNLGVVDPCASGALYGEPAPSAEVAGGIAALVFVERFGLALEPRTLSASPGLAQRLGAPGDPSSEDPRVREVLAESQPEARWLGDPEAAVRLALARATRDPALLSALSEDPEPLVRARAADALSDLDRLSSLVDDPSSVVRQVATQRLADLAHGGERDPRVGQALTRAAASGDAYQRWKAAYGLEAVPEGTETLLHLLQDVDIDVRRSAASALGHHPGPEVREALVAALSDENSFVRRWAARGLGALRDPAAIPALRQAAQEPTTLVAEAAAEALTRLGEPTRPPRFHPPARPTSEAELQAMIQHEDATVRKDVGKFLAGRPEAAEALLQLAQDPDSEVRKSAVEALSYHPAHARYLTRFLSDPDPDTLVSAIMGVARTRVGDPEALAALLDHGDSEVRLRAAEALTALHAASPLPEGPAARLAALIRDPDERLRAAAARAFPERVSADEPALLVRQIAAAAGTLEAPTQAAVRWMGPGATPEQRAWAIGLLVREDELVHVRFSWNDPADRPASHLALRPPLLRTYGQPNRG
ncbi:MAG: HEAT repeat domain-containing protein [Alphaproteobacteria bacterium]|nr:HEAT repeat domain-containing protein [Alphaproteobacteria bacterium]MCB9792291.1 HEAT repeat domain-containing protein [Alphaproteobacteria bacterium]